MKHLQLFSVLFLIASCNAAEQTINHSQQECDFSFTKQQECIFKTAKYNISAKLQTTKVTDDELQIKSILVRFSDKTEQLTLTPNTSLIDGDSGYVSFADINFDSIPDIAITTSFSTPNLYFDYWVYSDTLNKYVFVGNYPKFNIDIQHKSLNSTIKTDAAHYENNVWEWRNEKLTQIKK